MKRLIESLKNSTDLSVESIRRSVKESLFFIGLMAILLFVVVFVLSLEEAKAQGFGFESTAGGKVVQCKYLAPYVREDPIDSFQPYKIEFDKRECRPVGLHGRGFGGGFPVVGGGVGFYDNSWEGIAKGIVNNLGHTAIGVGAQVGNQYLQGMIYKKFYKPSFRSHTRGRRW